MKSRNSIIICLEGRLCGDPKTREVPEKTVLRWRYDPILCREVPEPVTRPARTFHIFSVATEGIANIPRWIKCIDWRGQIVAYRNGQRLRFTGFFRERILVRNGRPRTIRQFVLKGVEMVDPRGA